MRLAVGTYLVQLPAGSTLLRIENEVAAAATETWLKRQGSAGISRVQGGTMGQFSMTIRPITGPDGPWWVVSRNPDGSDNNVTTGVANVGAAFDIAKADGGVILSAATATGKNIDIFITF